MPTAIFTFVNSCNLPLPNGATTLTPVQFPVISGSAIAVGDQIYTTSDLGGTASFANIVLPNYYKVDFKVVKDTTTFYCYLPTSSVNLNGGNYSISCSINNGDGTDVYFNLVDMTSHPWAVKNVKLQPVYYPNVNNSNICVQDEVVLTTDANGAVTFPSVVPGTYMVTANGYRRSTVFFLGVPAYSGSVNAKDIMVLPTQQQLVVMNIPPAQIATGLTKAEADTYYQPIIQSGSYLFISVTNADTASLAYGSQTAVLADTASLALLAETASYSDFAVLAQTAITASNADVATFALLADSSSYATSASFSQEGLHAFNADSASFAVTTSYTPYADTASLALMADTASYVDLAQASISASYALSSSHADQADNAISTSYSPYSDLASTASYVAVAETSITASYTPVSDFATSASYAVTASYTPEADFAISTSYSPYADLALTASNADLATNALNANTASYVASVASASYAGTASVALNVPNSASYALQALSASYADNVPSSASYALFAGTASVALNVPDTASHATFAETASLAYTASYALNASQSPSASWASSSISSSYANNASNAVVSNYALGLNLTDVTTVNDTYDVLMWNANGDPIYGTYGNDQVLTYNPSTNTMKVTASAATSASFATTSSYAVTQSYQFNIVNVYAVSSSYASASFSSSYAQNASSASYIGSGVTGYFPEWTPQGLSTTSSIQDVSGVVEVTKPIELFEVGISMVNPALIPTFKVDMPDGVNAQLTLTDNTQTKTIVLNPTNSVLFNNDGNVIVTNDVYATKFHGELVGTADTASTVENANASVRLSGDANFFGILFGNTFFTNLEYFNGFAGAVSVRNDNNGGLLITTPTGHVIQFDKWGNLSGSNSYGSASSANSSSFSVSASYASYADTINRIITGSVTITDNTNVATLNIQGSPLTGGKNVSIVSNPAGMVFDAGLGGNIMFANDLMIGGQDIIASGGKFLGTASYADNAGTASLLLGSIVSASYALTASYALNGGSGGGSSASASWASASLSASVAVSASYAQSASWAPFNDNPNAVSASWASQSLSASYVPNLYPQIPQVSASWASASISASYAPFTDSPNAVSASWASSSVSASWVPNLYPQQFFPSASWASSSISASYVPDLYPQQFLPSASWASASISASYAANVPTTASYAVYATSASHALSADSADSLSFTPEVALSASWVSSSVYIQYSDTASVSFNADSASVAISASYAANVPTTASYAVYATSASFALNATPTVSASWASASISSSHSETASFSLTANVTSASYATTSSYAVTYSYVNSVLIASASLTSDFALLAGFALSASYAVAYSPTSSWANSASVALVAISASYAPMPNISNSSSWASSSVSASYALTASFALNGGTGGTSASSSWASHSISADTSSYISGSQIIFPAAVDTYFPVWQAGGLSNTSSLTQVGGHLTASGVMQATVTNANTAATALTSTTASFANVAALASNATNATSASYARTASFALNALPSVSSSWASSSISASYVPNLYPQVEQVSCSWASASLSASYAGNVPLTASYALEALSASYASNVPLTASYANEALSASYVDNLYPQNLNVTVSWASASVSASYVPNLYPQQFLPSASWASASISAISASYVPNLYPQNLNVTVSWASASISASYARSASWAPQTTSASWASSSLSSSYISQSIIFPSSTNGWFPLWDLHTLTSASLLGSNGTTITASGLIVGTITNAYTASVALNAPTVVTTSYSFVAVSASYAAQATSASYASNVPVTASYSLQSLSASYAANVPATASSALFAVSASYVPNLYPQTYQASASWASASVSASYAVTASSLNPGSMLYTVSGSDGIPPAYLEPYDLSPVTSVYRPPYKEGRMFWDHRYQDWAWFPYNDTSSISGSNALRMHLGKEVSVGVHNPTTASMTRMTVVYVGNTSQAGAYQPDVYPALADGLGNSNSSPLGVIRSDIPSGSNGFCLLNGVMHRTDMTQFGAVSIGTPLYLSPTDAGRMTTIKPGEPYDTILMGYVSELGNQGSFICKPVVQPHALNAYAGLVTLPIITNNEDGTVTFGNANCNLFSDANGNSAVKTYPISQSVLMPATGSANTNYVNVDYNYGNPIYTCTQFDTANGTTVVRAALLNAREDGPGDWDVDFLENGYVGLALANKIQNKDIDLYGLQRSDGLALTETGSRGVVIGGGSVYWGATKYSVDAVNSITASNEMYFFYHTGSDWKFEVPTGSITNQYYDNGTGLSALSTSYYNAAFVYRLIGTPDEFVYVLANNQYVDIAAAKTAQPPGDVPAYINSIGMLVGRIITQEGATNFTEIDSAFSTQFIPSSVSNHNSLAGLQGGAGGEYYHLSQADWTGTGTGSMVRQFQPVLSDPTFTATTPYHIPYWDTQHRLTKTGSVQVYNGVSVLINSGSPTVGNEEALLVRQTSPTSENVIGAYSEVNDFSQIYNQNFSSGALASTDIVATNDNGSQNVHYIDVGVASSTYNNPNWPWNKPNDGYVLMNGGDLWIGSDTNNAIRFFLNNTASVGFMSASGFFFTGSMEGTASNAVKAISASYVPNLYPQQVQVSASWASASISASYASNVPVTASYALESLSASYASNVPVTASYSLQSLSASYSSNVPETASYAIESLSASYISQSLYLPTAVDYKYVMFLANTLAVTSSITDNTHGVSVVGSVTASAGFSGNLYGNATTATSALTANFASSATNASVASVANSINFVPEAATSASWVSASVKITAADTASYVVTAQTASYFNQNPNATSASWASSSVSASFATNASNAYAINFIPTVAVSASWVSASAKITTADTASYITASNVVGTVTSASYAPFTQVTQVTVASASWVSASAFITTAQTASYVLNAVSASYAPTVVPTSVPSASWVSASAFITTAQTASYVLQGVSASFATTASYAAEANISYANNILAGAPVTMSVAGTWYDGPKTRLTPGTWFVTTFMTVRKLTTTANNYMGRINNNNTVYAQTQQYMASLAGQTTTLKMDTIVTTATEIGITGSCATDAATTYIMPFIAIQATGSVASQIVALQLA